MAEGSWYIDKWDRTLVRWHDGAGWTEFVADRAEWEALGCAPPPPEIEWGRGAGRAPGRNRVALGAAAALAVVFVAGAALAQDGDGDPSEPVEPSGSSTLVDRSTGSGGVRLGSDGTVTVTVAPPPDETAADTGTSEGSSSSVARRTTASTPRGTGSPETVRRTETITRTQTNPGPITGGVVGSADETEVGNSTATTIRNAYEPPPSTAPPTTAAPEPTTPTTADTVPQNPPP